MAWAGKYKDQYLQRKSAWVNKQHELILAANRWASKNIKQTAKKMVLCAGGSTLNMPKDNLVLLRDHPEGRDKIQIISNLNHSSLYQSIRTLMSTQFIWCVGVWYVWSIDDNCLTLRSHPLAIVGILIPRIHPQI